MKVRSLIAVLFCFFYVLSNQVIAQQKIQSISFKELDDRIHQPSDTTLLVHFWATWCRSCVEELETYNELPNQFDSKHLKVFFVSLDFKQDISTKLASFLEHKKIASEVVVLSESNGNDWIERIDKTWSGSIPATLLINVPSNKRVFFEGQANPELLSKEIGQMLKEKYD